ncbi:MAG: GNAT family N-acetyltransferase, partial [candidate division Zixibacteria bacterium]
SEVLIRELKKDDLDKSLAFFRALPKEDRAYLRVDVTKRDVVERRINAMESEEVNRLVAVVDGEIVADGSLEREHQEWKKHIAELRLIVAHPYQRKGLGLLMARELFALGASKKVEEILVRIMAPQVGALSIFKRLGFHQDAVLHDYVKDIDGEKHDLILMRCDLESLWRKLGDFMTDFDWQRTR